MSSDLTYLRLTTRCNELHTELDWRWSEADHDDPYGISKIVGLESELTDLLVELNAYEAAHNINQNHVF